MRRGVPGARFDGLRIAALALGRRRSEGQGEVCRCARGLAAHRGDHRRVARRNGVGLRRRAGRGRLLRAQDRHSIPHRDRARGDAFHRATGFRRAARGSASPISARTASATRRTACIARRSARTSVSWPSSPSTSAALFHLARAGAGARANGVQPVHGIRREHRAALARQLRAR